MARLAGLEFAILPGKGVGVSAMSRVKLAVLAACLLGPLVSACSQAEPLPRDFTLVNPHAAEDAGPVAEGDKAEGLQGGKWKFGKAKGGKTKGAKGEGTAPTLESVEIACQAEAQRKGIASIAAIFSRLRKDPTEEEYLACMKTRGYEVKQ